MDADRFVIYRRPHVPREDFVSRSETFTKVDRQAMYRNLAFETNLPMSRRALLHKLGGGLGLVGIAQLLGERGVRAERAAGERIVAEARRVCG